MAHGHEEGDHGDKAHAAAQRIPLLLYQYKGTTRLQAVEAAFKCVQEFTAESLFDCALAEAEEAMRLDALAILQAPEKPVGGTRAHHCPNCLKDTPCALLRCPRPHETICADCESFGWYMDEGIVRYRGRN